MFHFLKDSSERTLSKKIGLSRTTLRKALSFDESIKFSTLKTIARFFHHEIFLFTYPKDYTPDSTTVAIGYRIMRDGFDSWKIHLMDLVDEFRKSKDMRLLLLPLSLDCDEKIKTLVASTVIELCIESQMQIPKWATNAPPLAHPWLLSGMESLKAFAILESAYGFRSKNIFVQNNFLKRA